jgi:LmeA-like phospholipid-binding
MRSKRYGVATLALAFGLAIAFVIANGLIAWQIERRMEISLEDSLGFPVEVDLYGWPVVPRLLLGSVPQTRVTAHDVDVAGTGASVSLVQLTFEEVTWKWQRQGPLDPPIQAVRARFEVEVTERDLEELLGGLAEVRLTDGHLRLTGIGGLAADLVVAARGGGVVLRPDVPVVDIELYLPIDSIVHGRTRTERVLVEDGRLVLTGSVEGLDITGD